MEDTSDTQLIAGSEKKISDHLKELSISDTSLIKKQEAVKKIRFNDELFQQNGDNPIDELSGVCIDGVHYYDFKNVQFINNTGMATLIDLLKCLLEQGTKVQFVNVNERIKIKIKSMGLEDILNCS